MNFCNLRFKSAMILTGYLFDNIHSKIELYTIKKPWVKLTKIFFSLFPKPPQFLYYNFSKSQTEKVLKSLPYEKSWIWLFKILSCTQNKHISLVNILKDCSSWKSRMNLVRHKIFIWQCFIFPHKLSKPLLGSFIFIFPIFIVSWSKLLFFSENCFSFQTNRPDLWDMNKLSTC